MGVGAPSMVWGLPEHCARLPELFSLRGWGEDPGLLLSPGEAGATQQHKLCIFSPCCTRVGEPQAPPSPLLSPKAPSSPQVQPGLPRAVVMLGWGFPPGVATPIFGVQPPSSPPPAIPGCSEEQRAPGERDFSFLQLLAGGRAGNQPFPACFFVSSRPTSARLAAPVAQGLRGR